MRLPTLFMRNNRAEKYESVLFSECTFYDEFLQNLRIAESEVIIESPFLTSRRVNALLPVLATLVKRGVGVVINTRDPSEHDIVMRVEAESVLAKFQQLGITTLYTGKLHRKLAIIDQRVVWDGSLNILSQYDSCEIMRKTVSREYAKQLVSFINIGKFLAKD